mmetsp:Transcript_69517/g.122944  ORF Transcript_69517/g.122944 Transcript_69517/m.122944 type:complete len:85 (-) Transcript_69517:26-280(-)
MISEATAKRRVDLPLIELARGWHLGTICWMDEDAKLHLSDLSDPITKDEFGSLENKSQQAQKANAINATDAFHLCLRLIFSSQA